MSNVPLSVLDLAPVAAGASAAQALEYTTTLARRTEELGYRRFWVAEHQHACDRQPRSAVLIAHLAAGDLHDPGRLGVARRCPTMPR